MTKTKIALYVALIFLAGAITGAGVRSVWKTDRPAAPPPADRDNFAKHIFNRIKDRLELTPEQVEKVEPVFLKGFAEVRAIQDQSIKEVQAAVKRNHEEIAKLVTPEQRQKLEEMDKEHKKFREMRSKRRGQDRREGGSSESTNVLKER